jgi:hypothetical protein
MDSPVCIFARLAPRHSSRALSVCDPPYGTAQAAQAISNEMPGVWVQEYEDQLDEAEELQESRSDGCRSASRDGCWALRPYLPGLSAQVHGMNPPLSCGQAAPDSRSVSMSDALSPAAADSDRSA